MAVKAQDWFKAFWDADRQIWKEAAEEVISIGFISIVPLLFAGLAADMAGLINPAEMNPPFGSRIWQTISSGQLLFYAISFIATIVYYSSRDFKKNFPIRLYYILISIAVCAFAVMLIALDPSLEKLQIPAISITSFVVYFLCAAMYWTITVFKELDPADYYDTMRTGEASALESLENRRGAK